MMIGELCKLFVDEQNIKVYDLENNGKVIYEGSSEDTPMEIDVLDIVSIDNLDRTAILGINVSIE